MDREQIKTIWNQRPPEDRADWIKGAGFTISAASRYRDISWDMLPPHIQETLIEQES